MNLQTLNRRIVACRECPRLVTHCEEVAREKRRAYRDQEYWGKPVPSFGDPGARILVVGLAPGAHGANRTGRMFTGDRSGDFLYRSLYRAGLASQPESTARNDGLTLRNTYITAAAHCAPPDNKPSPAELKTCRQWLYREFDSLTCVRVVVVLGRIALDAWLGLLKERGLITRTSGYAFGHGVEHDLTPRVLCSYHPSQQNTSTGRLTQEMLDAIFVRAAELARV